MRFLSRAFAAKRRFARISAVTSFGGAFFFEVVLEVDVEVIVSLDEVEVQDEVD